MLIIRASLRDLKPQIAVIFSIVDEEFEALGCPGAVVTSAWRKPGATRSLHPEGYAADFDHALMPEHIEHPKWATLQRRVRDRLGDEFDVIAHGPRAHLHVEYDPKTVLESVPV